MHDDVGLQGAARHAEVDTDDLLILRANDHEGPASAGPSRVIRMAAVLLLLGGCAVGGDGDEKQGAGRQHLPEELAVPAKVGAGAGSGTDPNGSTGGTGSDGATSATTGAVPAGGGGAPDTTSTTAPGGGGGGRPATPYVTKLTLTDRADDAGLQAPPYGDLVLHRLEEDGSRARFVVQVAGALPAQPADGEVIGIGIDVVRGEDDDRGYQVFVLGNADGWRAWVQDPDGNAVEFDGTLAVAGDTVVATVPWVALGGRLEGSIHVFADWSKARLAVVADSSNDHAPNQGRQPYSL